MTRKQDVLTRHDAVKARASAVAENILAEIKSAVDLAETENRDLTTVEDKYLDALFTKVDALADTTIEPRLAPTERADGPRDGIAPSTRWRDSEGREVRVFNRGQALAPVYSGEYREGELSIGRMIQGIASGHWRSAEAERRAMSTTANSAGGFLVPDPLWGQFIDLARNKSVLFAAGAQTIPMTSDYLTLAKLTADPTMEVKVENAAFAGSDPTFGALTLGARTIGTVCTLSRELAADAPNAASIIESALSQAVALKLDYLGLHGSGTMSGLDGWASINTLSSVGADMTWDDVLDAILECQKDNHEPNACIFSPHNANDLRKLKTGDGANAAKFYVTPPPDVAKLLQLVSTQCTDAMAYVGDFTNVLIGIRQGALIETTTQAGDAFSKHQLLIKVTLRADMALADGGSVCLLPGIS
jgi:HK97 family phage major capsid protein